MRREEILINVKVCIKFVEIFNEMIRIHMSILREENVS